MHRNKTRGYAEAQEHDQDDAPDARNHEDDSPGLWADPWANLEETLAPDLLDAPSPPKEEDSDHGAELEQRVAAEINDMRLRQAAEMDNFKKRLAREHDEQLRYAAEKVLSDLLPTLDNLDLALLYGTSHDACKDMLQGVAMTQKLLLEAVGKHGLVPFGEEGTEFTPELHEAVGFDQRNDLAAGSVARVLQRGYKLKERLLRPAKVMINQ